MRLTPTQIGELRRTGVETANRIAKAIELCGLSRVDVAKGTDLPYTYVTDVASGRFQTITVENAHKFAQFFGARIEDLFPARQAVA